eukprot:TRINITY_DN10427_c0_g2_i2.p1 TRINITY_DN10427_c0_g2~~TRINITY_DN10427_c0_g2_i2.p1  ORF type:complete len:164 (+),score=11.74 TRINITY_DN10427_c0_g2_i2:279-770(+)
MAMLLQAFPRPSSPFQFHAGRACLPQHRASWPSPAYRHEQVFSHLPAFSIDIDMIETYSQPQPELEGKLVTQKPLTQYPAGSIVRIAGIDGGRHARARMLAMGMTPGCPVEILSGGHAGCRVRVRGSDVVLCCGLAEKIMAVENNAKEGPHCNCCPSPHAKAS